MSQRAPGLRALPVERLVTASIVLGVSFIACGGKAVIDEPSGGGGSSTTTSSTSSTTTSTTTSGAQCPVPPPPPFGALSFCGGSSTSSNGGPAECLEVLCDAQDNRYEIQCTGLACSCSYDDQLLCSCTNDSPGQACGVQSQSCCPPPFP